MSAFAALVLGVVQGLTEFLPISSDGHLALAYKLLGMKPDLAFEVFLHLGTLIATVVYFRRDLLEMVRALLPYGPAEEHPAAHAVASGDTMPPASRSQLRRLDALIVVGTIVSAAIALGMNDVVEPLSENLVAVGAFFFVTAAALALAEALHRRVRPAGEMYELPWWKSAAIGLAQGAAVLPAVSRSGMTIASGMLSGLDREQAARFSFLLGVPLIAAANLKSALDVLDGSAAMPPAVPLAIGFVAALITGYLAVAGLLSLVRKHSLTGFAVYTALLGSGVLIFALTR